MEKVTPAVMPELLARQALCQGETKSDTRASYQTPTLTRCGPGRVSQGCVTEQHCWGLRSQNCVPTVLQAGNSPPSAGFSPLSPGVLDSSASSSHDVPQGAQVTVEQGSSSKALVCAAVPVADPMLPAGPACLPQAPLQVQTSTAVRVQANRHSR